MLSCTLHRGLAKDAFLTTCWPSGSAINQLALWNPIKFRDRMATVDYCGVVGIRYQMEKTALHGTYCRQMRLATTEVLLGKPSDMAAL